MAARLGMRAHFFRWPQEPLHLIASCLAVKASAQRTRPRTIEVTSDGMKLPRLLCLQLDAAAMQDRFGIAIRLLAPLEDEIESGLEGDGAVEIA